MTAWGEQKEWAYHTIYEWILSTMHLDGWMAFMNVCRQMKNGN